MTSLLASPVTVGLHYYWLGLHSGSAASVGRYAWDPGSGAVRRFNTDVFSDGASDPFGPSLGDNQRISIYAVGGRNPTTAPSAAGRRR